MEKKAVFCKDCKFFEFDEKSKENICNSENRIYQDTPLERLDITNPEVKNKFNNCSDFKMKKKEKKKKLTSTEYLHGGMG